jgi:osmotically-inducible protein OsmY
MEALDRYDEENTRDASEVALNRDVLTEPDRVEVSVHNAIAVLDGIVDTYFEKQHDEDVGAQAACVERIVNVLSVDNPNLY